VFELQQKHQRPAKPKNNESGRRAAFLLPPETWRSIRIGNQKIKIPAPSWNGDTHGLALNA
jgi:hypothetical protein